MKILSRKQIVLALKHNAAILRVELWRVEAAIAALGDGKLTGRPPGKQKSKMSAKARAAISRAQRARWAKLKAVKAR
jgi:hypothetical protein